MSASKAKGTAAETAVVRFLQANGYPHAERRALAGAQDRGDVAGIPGLIIEVKNADKMELGMWMNELARETPVGDMGVVWHKRRGHTSAGAWYVTMTGSTLLEFLEGWTR
jgi:hypothetical protein